ncbi:hypothetical protein [Deinococcus frigens]|nr:hypothetical protein [Deinococcus frigens]
MKRNVAQPRTAGPARCRLAKYGGGDGARVCELLAAWPLRHRAVDGR